MLQKNAFNKYIGQSFTLDDVPTLKTRYKNADNFSSSSMRLEFDSRTGIFSKYPAKKDLYSSHQGDAELLFRVVQNLNLELATKAESIYIFINSYKKTDVTPDDAASKDVIYTVQYTLSSARGEPLLPYTHVQGENELAANPNKGVIVVSLSQKCDRDALAAVAFLKRVGVQNAHESLSEPGYGSKNPIKPSRKKLQEQITALQTELKEKGKLADQLKRAEGELGVAADNLRSKDDELRDAGSRNAHLANEIDKVKRLKENLLEEFNGVYSRSSEYRAKMEILEKLRKALEATNLKSAHFGNRQKKIDKVLNSLWEANNDIVGLQKKQQ